MSNNISLLTDKQLEEKSIFVNQYVLSDNASNGSSVDANANVSTKNVATLAGEFFKDYASQFKRFRTCQHIEKLFGKEQAEKYLEDLNNHVIYAHDETHPFFYYCASVTMYPFLLNGTKELGGESGRPKNLKSFCGSFINLCFSLSSQLAGALATTEFLLYFNYFAIKDYGRDYLKTHLKEVHDHFQQVVYSLNTPAAARSYQSIFWNISIFDEYYFKAIFGEFKFPDDDCTEPDWETLKELQKEFMTWFNKERTRALLTFPVVTAAMLTDGNKPKDKEFKDFLAKEMSEGNSFFVYMSENAEALSSCCFEGDELITVKDLTDDGSEVTITVREFVLKATSKDISKGKYKIISVNPITLEDEEVTITGTLEKDNNHNKLVDIHYTFYNQPKKVSVTPDHLFLVKNNLNGKFEEVSAEKLIDSYNNYKLITEDKKFIVISNVNTREHKGKVYDIELEKNHYFIANNIVTHNCRLRNEMQDNQFSFSLGAGGVSTGSMNVITLNVNRFVQDIYKRERTKDTAVISKYIKEKVEDIHKYQMGVKSMLKEYENAGMMPMYTAGYISTKKQYLTTGINGLLESAEFLGYTPNNNPEYIEYIESILKTIYDTDKEALSKYKQRFNLELVPAESLGVKNYNWDKADGYKVPENRYSYNSYLYRVEDTEIDIVDKFILHGKDTLRYLDGGSALHLNLEEYPTKKSYSKLFDIAASTGCNYWTTNVKITICEDCGNIDKRTLNACPKCNSKNISYATRIIGYLKKVSSFSSERQKEEALRYYHKSNV